MNRNICTTSRTAVASAALLLGLAACSSSPSGNNAGSTPTSAGASTGTVAAAAKLLPAAVKSKGTLTVGMEAQYAPFEYLATDNKTITGFDADFAQALGGALGLKVNLTNTSFDSIIPGLQGGKYDLGISAFTDTKAREKVVDFVTYFSEGQSLMTQAGNPDHLDINNLCGKTIGIGKGGTEELIVVPELSKACQAAGKPPINKKVFSGQDAPNLAVASGQVQGTILDQTVAEATAKASNGKFSVAGQPIDKSPVGIAIPKTTGMTNAVHAAVQALIDNGTYKNILAKWNVQAGAITTSQVNVARS
ncbi:ABC transporter substrate-binding protein [Actinacidiphila soli]|uniref:ABC transporter substrate-binding protein n=1 Tax=Actinacidiphila soli TaxID=2487275 RepID=UPI000FCB957C|nr:ABC transporter substrate-binding protein [Actinacidiphila soli]